MYIYEDSQLERYIIFGLKRGWSPKIIAGRMRKTKQQFYACKSAIYAYLYSPYGQQYCKYLRSRRYHKRKFKGKKAKRSLIPNKVSIHDRPDRGNEYGHFEADTIVSGKKTESTTALSTIYDPKSMYLDARKIPNLSPIHHTNALLQMLKKFKRVRSVTQDNGIENIDHEKLKTQLAAQTYFCDPHSPWQKPGIENANKLIRRRIPKGSDISKYSAAMVRSIIKENNSTPRENLDWTTPLEIVKKRKLFRKKKAP